MSKRTPPKAPARKASKRPSRARPAVDKKKIARCGTAKIGELSESKAAAHAAADFASQVLSGNFLPPASPAPKPKPSLTRDDIRTARELVDTGVLPDLQEAFRVIRKEVYGYSEPYAALAALEEQVNQSMAASANCAASMSFSYAAQPEVVKKAIPKLRMPLPDQVFETRRQLDAVHKQLRQLIFTLEPVLTVGPRCSLFQRQVRPSGSKPDDHNETRNAELTYAVENIEDSVGDLQVILAHLVSSLALPFQDDPDNCQTAVAPSTPYPG